MRLIAGVRERLRGLFSRTREDAETEREIRFHVEMETERIMRDTGADRREARRRAYVAFGGVERYREEVRDARGLAWVSGLSLDFKLGLRNLVKRPGLAIVGGLGMAVATAIGAGGHAVINSYFYPKIPLHEGERLIRILKVDTRYGGTDSRLLYDLVFWRQELRSVVDIGAFRGVTRNLISPSGDAEPITLAEMTASGFRAARVPPLLGRPLLEADERPDAPPVMVIGYDVWQSRFGGDPSVVGRTVRLGRDVHTIVGIMPEGFYFPVSHSYWVPMRVPPAERVKPESGPSMKVFGRLVPGATMEAAEAELAVLQERQSIRAGHDETGRRFRPLVAPYTDVFTNGRAEGEERVYPIVQALLSLLMVVVCLNVAVLVYARTVARTGEIAVRTALGATRRRIVGQLFAEAFVLSGLSALLGLTMVIVGLRFLHRGLSDFSATGRAPFWIQTGLAASTVLYALALAVLGAVIVGVFPALRATGTQLRLAMGTPGGGGKAQLGRTWTFLIVAQVAVAVAVLPAAMLQGGELLRHATQALGFPAEEFLAVEYQMDRDDTAGAPADSARGDSVPAPIPALVALLQSKPGVVGVTVSTSIPGGGGTDRVELDVPGRRARVRVSMVDREFFGVFGVRLLAGRNFSAADAVLPRDRPAIVNRTFVDQALGGGEAVGRRMRYPSDGDSVPRWIEIVGVVEDFPAGFRDPTETGARVYHLQTPAERLGSMLFVRVRGQTPDGFAPTLQRLAPTVDPTLQLTRVSSLAKRYAEERRASGLTALAIAIITASVLLLSAAGIHALMSFTVNQRRREIGVRAALGAGSRQILTSVLARAVRQLAVGLGVGLVLAFAVDRATGGELLNGKGAMVAPVVAACMLVVGLLAAMGPARRGLRVQPTEALRAEG